MDVGWQRCLNSYLTTIEDRSGSIASRRVYASTLRRFLASVADPAKVSRSDVLDFLQAHSTSKRNRGKPVSAATKNQRVTIIRSFYTFASTYEINGTPLFQRPLPTIGIQRLKASETLHTLNADELARLFAVIPQDTVKGLRDRALFLTYFYCARRRAEILSLKIGEIEAAVIGGRATHTYKYRAKGTSRTVRTAELPLPAYQAIVRYLDASGRTLTPESYIFVSVHPGQGRKDNKANVPLNKDYANRLFKDYCAKAGLSYRLSLHSLRHASARARYEAGSDIRAIQHVLGHENISTTDRYLRVLLPTGDSGAQLLQEKFRDL